MRKTYLARRNALLNSKHISWSIGVLGIVAIVFALRTVVPDFFWYTVSPLFSVSNALTAQVHSATQGLSDAATVAQENESLQKVNDALAVKNQTLTQKLADVTKLLNASEPTASIAGILASVVVRPPESPYDTFVLAAGKSKGVAVGMEAFGQDGVPIGIVSGYSNDFSRLTLFSAPGTKTDGWVGSNNTPVTIIGDGGGAFSATVARAVKVAVGDIVFIPGPGRLPMGKVVRVDSNPLSPSVVLRIEPAANLFSTPWVVLRDTGHVPVTFATSTQL